MSGLIRALLAVTLLGWAVQGAAAESGAPMEAPIANFPHANGGLRSPAVESRRVEPAGAAPAMMALFDPATNVIPFPNNLLLSGSRDLTINTPVANPSNFSDPAVALNAVDGFSTIAPWSVQFSAAIEPGSIHAGTGCQRHAFDQPGQPADLARQPAASRS